ELNIVSKAAREGLSLKGSSIFVTLSPCINCSKHLFQAGVERVVYLEEYRDTKGLDYLKSHGVIIEKYENND
ncbi:deoxycytidylate deaminase, partial [Staphylococcus aureus]